MAGGGFSTRSAPGQELDAARRALARARRALMAVSAVNREIVRAADEAGLLRNICKVMVHTGGYKMAWIGKMLHDERKTVFPCAWSGFDDDYLATAKITWADEPAGQGPTGAALRTMKPVINKDSQSNPNFARWREQAVRRGFASSAAFPFLADGEPFGALMVYSTEKDAFDQEEIGLLAGLAADAGFGVSVLRERERRVRAEREREALLDRMRQTQKIHSLGMLASGVAHDFNNMLTSILMNLDLARRSLPASSPAVENLRNVADAAHRSAEICRQMLTFAGKGSGKKELLDVNMAVAGILRLTAAVTPKNVRLETHFSQHLRPVFCDPAQMTQVILNLVTNAMEAMTPQGGALTIRTQEAQCALGLDGALFESPDFQEGPCLLLEVADTGCGMEKPLLDRIFEPFFTTKPQGRGLGLALTLGIINNHQGAISIQTSPGKGSVFRILIPMREAGASLRPPAAPAGPLWGAERRGILVIEDEERLREACEMALTMAGYKVFLAENGREGLKILSQQPSDIGLVILDLSMPVMDGKETLDFLEREGRHVSVILTSGYDKAMEDKMPSSNFVTAFLSKPYSADQLLASVRNVLAAQRSAPD